MNVTVIHPKPLRTTGRGDSPERATLLLNLWEWADHFGEGVPITLDVWKSYVYQDEASLKRETWDRAWHRFKRAAKRSPFPVEFRMVESEERPRAVRAVVFPKGTREVTRRILDRIERNREMDALFKTTARAARAKRPVPSWVVAAASVGVHREVPCPECGEPEGLSCQDTRPDQVSSFTTLHLSRVYAAMQARDDSGDDE